MWVPLVPSVDLYPKYDYLAHCTIHPTTDPDSPVLSICVYSQKLLVLEPTCGPPTVQSRRHPLLLMFSQVLPALLVFRVSVLELPPPLSSLGTASPEQRRCKY